MHLSFRSIEWKLALEIINAVRSSVAVSVDQAEFRSSIKRSTLEKWLGRKNPDVGKLKGLAFEGEKVRRKKGSRVHHQDEMRQVQKVEMDLFDWCITFPDFDDSKKVDVAFFTEDDWNELWVFWDEGGQDIMLMLCRLMALFPYETVVGHPLIDVHSTHLQGNRELAVGAANGSLNTEGQLLSFISCLLPLYAEQSWMHGDMKLIR